MARYLFDIETNGFLDVLNTVHSLVLKDIDTHEVISCTDSWGDIDGLGPDTSRRSIKAGLELLLEADQIVGHNIIKFDLPAIQKVYPWFHIPDDVISTNVEGNQRKVIDTLNLSRLIWTDLKDRDFGFRKKNPEFPGNLIGRHGLEAWGWRLRLHKGDYSKEMKEKGLNPWAEWNPEMQSYCEQDVEVTEALWKLIQKKEPSAESVDIEMDFQHIIFKQEQVGFPFDKQEAEKLYVELSGRRYEIEQELQEVFPPWWRGTYHRVTKDVNRFVPCSAGKEKRYSRVTPTGKKVLQYRSKMSDAVWEKHDWEFESRGYFLEEEEGAEFNKISLITFNPGSRDHISDRLIAIHGWKPKAYGQDGKPTVDEEVLSSLKYPEAKLLSEYLLVQKRIGQVAEGNQAWLKVLKDDGKIHGEVITNGAVTGRCTHQRPNVAQTPAVGVPYGEQCRSLFHAPDGWSLLGADASGLELRCLAHYMARFDDGAYANEVLNGDIHTINQKAAGLPTRSNAKTFIYGFLYGAGDAKIGQIVGKGRQAGRKLKEQFLERTPALKKLRNAVQSKIATKAGHRWILKKDAHLKGLDGRKLHIRSEHSALNTLLQSAGALAVKKATILFYIELTKRGYVFGKDWMLVAHVHDEFQALVRKGLEEEISNVAVQSFRDAGEHFKFRCALDGEAKVGRNWAETH